VTARGKHGSSLLGSQHGWRRARSCCRLAVLLGLACFGGVGCAAYDDFSWKQMNFEVFHDPKDPLAVIKDDKAEGWARRRAIQCLKEPLANGGTQQDQDVILTVLSYCAANDNMAPCRMAAIDTLRTFKDARVVEALKDAYYRAGSMPPESATVIRMLALSALGDTRNPTAVDTLIRVLREPPTEGPDVDRQQKLNERAAAARALAHFKKYEATAALVAVLEKEDDVALRTRAHESLVSATGKDLPPDAQAWKDFLSSGAVGDGVEREPTFGQRLMQLTGWNSE
jgi:hypothetical protein